jgi:phenylacetic acid degradation operon negative regulatory protein
MLENLSSQARDIFQELHTTKKREKTFCTFEKQILCLLSHVPQMESKEFLDIYQARNFSPQYIRNTLSKMKKDGHIASPKRSAYAITSLGLNCLRSLNYKPLKYKQAWDNTWYMIVFEIPESQRNIRDSFRADLVRLGFGMLYNAVYISPWNYWTEISEIARHYGILNQITMLHGDCLINAITQDMARVIWNLDTISALYREKLCWFKQEFLPVAQLLSENTKPLDWFIHYLKLGDQLCELSIIDPALPKELLPYEWPGETVHHELGAALNQFIDRIAGQSYYGRFVK